MRFQVVQGRLFGMVQSKANRWIHLLLPVLLAALLVLGGTPRPAPLDRPSPGGAAVRESCRRHPGRPAGGGSSA